MREKLLYSLLELGHATSQNLGFAHQTDVYVSYGEETITETNLLELRRRNPTIVRLKTFDKNKEALTGADWEWHLIGRARQFRMRIQAKRIQRDNKLKIPHKVKSSGQQQIALLIADAKINRLKPVYCLYSSEVQRSIWQNQYNSKYWKIFESGCLLVSAHKVNYINPTALSDIEAHCIPWHHLVERKQFGPSPAVHVTSDNDVRPFRRFIHRFEEHQAPFTGRAIIRDFPTIDELNSEQRIDGELEGIAEADSPDYRHKPPDEAYYDRGITRLIEIDVRGFTA